MDPLDLPPAVLSPPAVRNGAGELLDTLLELGVDTVFGYPGGAVLPLYDALCDRPALRHVLVRHEQAAVHAAQGYARSTGRPGVVIGTDRPGLGTNALLLNPVGAIAYRYGEGSFRKHQAGARRAGLPFRVIRRFGLAFDLDTPADLEEMRARLG